jgi:hypothetical protein
MLDDVERTNKEVEESHTREEIRLREEAKRKAIQDEQMRQYQEEELKRKIEEEIRNKHEEENTQLMDEMKRVVDEV